MYTCGPQSLEFSLLFSSIFQTILPPMLGLILHTKLSSMEFSWCPRRQVLRWKYILNQSRTFKGPHRIHLVWSIIIKACEARMDYIEDMAEKKILPLRSGLAVIHDGKNMASKINISCVCNCSYIGDHKFIWQIPATAKVQGMSTGEQGVQNCSKV